MGRSGITQVSLRYRSGAACTAKVSLSQDFAQPRLRLLAASFSLIIKHLGFSIWRYVYAAALLAWPALRLGSASASQLKGNFDPQQSGFVELCNKAEIAIAPEKPAGRVAAAKVSPVGGVFSCLEP
jgi:hypothetical protein